MAVMLDAVILSDLPSSFHAQLPNPPLLMKKGKPDPKNDVSNAAVAFLVLCQLE